jgi:aubergine-like protein
MAKQGVVQPSHYHVIYDTIKESEEKIQTLTYKLCFTYYNVVGSIKVPAPLQYANRLANLIGDRSRKSGKD